MDWLIVRLKEETTWAGIVFVVSAVAGYFSPELAKEITAIGGTIIGALFIKRNDNPGK